MPPPKWLSNPVLGLLGVVLSALALVFALYSYFTAQTYRELRYAVAPERAILIDSKKASDFEINYQGKTVRSDVASAIITIWNDGTEAIRRENILRPVTITLDNTDRILEAKALRISRPATGFTLDPSKLHEGTVLLSWDILDRKDGAVIQIIYEGGPKEGVTVTGDIEDSRPIAEYSLERPARGPLWWFLGITMGLLIIGNIYRNVRYRKNLYLHLEIINWLYPLLFPCMLMLGGLSPALSDNAVRCQNRLVHIGDTTAEVLEKCGDPVWKGGWEEAPNRTISRFYDYKRDRYKAPESTRGPLRIDVWTYDFGSNRFVRYLHFENDILIRIETGEKGAD